MGIRYCLLLLLILPDSSDGSDLIGKDY